MASFINLMANDVWSEADIKRRLHAEIRSVISEDMENEVSRAIQGRMLGMHTLTLQEQAAIGLFKATTDRVAALGIAARADAVLLSNVLALEAAQARLQLSPVAVVYEDDLTTIVNQSEVDVDTAERSTAQGLVAAAAVAVVDLYTLRNPTPDEVTL